MNALATHPMSAQNSASGPGVGPRRPPGQGQQQQAFPGANRYTLVDPGSSSASNGSSSTPRADSRSPSRAAGRPPMRRGASAAAGPGSGAGGPGGAGAALNGPAGALPGPTDAGFGAPKAPGPQTFAEMGITTTKVEDEKCTIM